ncbi:MAG: hypothetical protein U9R08_05130 [Nanoarchaeota archaeon]|nr:hypothetical protein [Nanoarchaeota archaeon]
MGIIHEIETEIFSDRERMQAWEDLVEDEDMNPADAGIMLGAESA